MLTPAATNCGVRRGHRHEETRAMKISLLVLLGLRGMDAAGLK